MSVFLKSTDHFSVVEFLRLFVVQTLTSRARQFALTHLCFSFWSRLSCQIAVIAKSTIWDAQIANLSLQPQYQRTPI